MPQTKTESEVYLNCTDETLDFRTLDSGDATEEEPLDFLDEDKCELRDRLESEDDTRPSSCLQANDGSLKDDISAPSSVEAWPQYPSPVPIFNPNHLRTDEIQPSHPPHHHMPAVFSHHGVPMMPACSGTWSPRFSQPFSPTFWMPSGYPPHGHHMGPPPSSHMQMDASSGMFPPQMLPAGMFPYSCQPPFPMMMSMGPPPPLLPLGDPNMVALNPDGTPCNQPPVHMQFPYPPFDHPGMDPNFNFGHPDDLERRKEDYRWYQPKPSHIKKPLNAFMLFMREMRPKILKDCGEKESTAINQIIGRHWQALSKEDQAKYYEMAKKEKDEHQRMYPHWTPRDQFHHPLRKRRRRERSNPNDPIAKKCRARFGLDHQDKWCKPCRRKKKCSRFSGSEDNVADGTDMQSENNTQAPDASFPVIHEFGDIEGQSTLHDHQSSAHQGDEMMTGILDQEEDGASTDNEETTDDNREDGENYPPFAYPDTSKSPARDDPRSTSKQNLERESARFEIDTFCFSTFSINGVKEEQDEVPNLQS